MSVPRSSYLSPVWRDGLFENKVLFCTGGAGTICSAQVRAFVALGGNAAITGRNAEKTERMARDIEAARPGSKVLPLVVDVRDAKAMADAAERTVKELGSLDFAIAGAAGNFLAPLAQMSANAFKTVMDIDALGSFNTAKACIPHLVDSAQRHKNTGKAHEDGTLSGTGGRLLFVSATFHYHGQPLQAHVQAAKAAVDQISVSFALEYGPLGVTSNIIAPGPIADTEGVARLSHPSDRERKQRSIPIGRWGYVKEIADATVYLFSDAGNYVNGHGLVVDGGQWRVAGPNMDDKWPYPTFLLSGDAISGVAGGKKAKL
ncbi:oxidoreductase [Polychaeton citri CBS 116435]|uniref:2,4-dienoyl-CoA reductase [(3E)-enoyl-CoA-producing] n=1 Tax=Polychaeton citri CBS 116435 TaxID=1314669 RepID=A0A9P4Q7I7_9PEZI|nr:oxidoreductase [Polychaeton citri CBS 116435]